MRKWRPWNREDEFMTSPRPPIRFTFCQASNYRKWSHENKFLCYDVQSLDPRKQGSPRLSELNPSKPPFSPGRETRGRLLNRPRNIAENLATDQWTVDDAREVYGINRWGMGYFGVSENGSVLVKAPTSNGLKTIEFSEILDKLRQRGLDMPVMLRLENLVDDRITQLNEGFTAAIKETSFQGQYRGVFSNQSQPAKSRDC